MAGRVIIVRRLYVQQHRGGVVGPRVNVGHQEVKGQLGQEPRAWLANGGGHWGVVAVIGNSFVGQ